MSNIYKIGVAIMLTSNGLAPALSMMSHQLLGIHRSVAQINSGIGRWRTGLIGAAGVMGGSMMLGGLAKVMHYGEKFLDQQAKLQILGLNNKQIAEATAKSWSNTRSAPGTKVADNLASIGDMFSIVGFEHAMEMSKKLAQVDQVLKAVTGKENGAYAITKSAELMGKIVNSKTGEFDAAGFNNFVDLVTRSAIATHGKVGPAEWLAQAKQGAVALGSMSEDGLLATVSSMQAMGGFRSGTAGQALTRQMIGGVMAKRVAKDLERIGLLKPGGWHSEGGGVTVEPGALKGGDVLQRSQLEFFHDVVMPAWAKHGIVTPEQQQQQFYKDFGTGPAQRMAFEFIRGFTQITGEIARNKLASGAEGAIKVLNKNSPIAAKAAAEASYENMMTAMGSPVLQASIPWMNTFTTMLNSITSMAVAHPTAVKIIGEGFAAIGIVLIGVGGLALLAAIGPFGWIAAGILGLGIVITNAKAIWAWLTGVKETTGSGYTPSGPGDTPDQPARALRPLRRSVEPPPRYDWQGEKMGAVYMDGRKVGSIVSGHQLASVNGPLKSSSTFDGNSAMIPVGLSAAYA